MTRIALLIALYLVAACSIAQETNKSGKYFAGVWDGQIEQNSKGVLRLVFFPDGWFVMSNLENTINGTYKIAASRAPEVPTKLDLTVVRTTGDESGTVQTIVQIVDANNFKMELTVPNAPRPKEFHNSISLSRVNIH